MASFRDKNHQLGSTINGALRLLELVQEQLKGIKEPGTEQAVQRIYKNTGLLIDAIMKISEQTDQIKSIAYRFLDPDKALVDVETKIRTENNAYKILIVDDEEVVVECSKQLFERRGFKAFTATGVEEAKQKIQEYGPDIIILDLALPADLEGVEILRLIKEQRPSCKVIVVTKEDNETQLASVRALMPDRILVKPVMIDQLVAQINAIIGKGV